MLFLFVLMLVGVDQSDSLVETIRGQRWIGLLAGLGLAVVLAGVVGRATFPPATGLDSANDPSNPVGLAHLVFGSYVFAFEVVGALLVTAALGALVLTHRRRLTPRVGQRERADARVKAGAVLTPLPAPGVYARHNAMDVPALGPNGVPIEHSVPRVLRVRGQQADEREYAARVERVLAGEWASGEGSTAIRATTEADQTPGADENPPPHAHPEGADAGAPVPGAATDKPAQEEQG
jgi:NADH-quinone oxidoreductase subunit J